MSSGGILRSPIVFVMMNRPTVVVSLLVVCLLVGCVQAPVGQKLSVVAESTPPAPFPVPVVELSGTPEQIAEQHARALGEQIQQLHTDYLMSFFRNDAQRFLALTAARGFESHLRPEHLAEIQALAKDLSIDPRQMMLAQCFLDLTAMTACSTITLPAQASPDGVARFGRNLDFPSFNIADKYSVLLVYRPENKHAFAAVSWPGLVGVLSGMNEHGLALANMEVNRSARLPMAMPYTLLYRTVLEECRTVNEAIALLERTPRQSANNLMLMDASGDRAVVEIRPESITVRRATVDQPLISTNHQRSAADPSTLGRCDRYDTLYRTSTDRFGQIAATDVQRMLQDVQQENFTLQSMIFEPATRTIHLAVGPNAAEQPFGRLDLKLLFRR